MTVLRIVEYGCSLCGTEITVTGDGSGHISPIYCCGILVSTKDIKEAKRSAPALKRPTKKPSPAAKKKSASSGKTASARKPKTMKKKK